MSDIVGITELGEVMKRKRVRWAASVYHRGVTELKEVAENILSEHLEEDTGLRWPEGTKKKIQGLKVLESVEEGVYTDGSRIHGRTAAATITTAEYLGRYATVMDAELLAVAMRWELGDTVITDSQAAIGRIANLQHEQARVGSKKEW